MPCRCNGPSGFASLRVKFAGPRGWYLGDPRGIARKSGTRARHAGCDGGVSTMLRAPAVRWSFVAVGFAFSSVLGCGDAGPGGEQTGTFWIAPTAFPLDVGHGPPGTQFTLHLKGVGWTETANIYTVV